MSKIMLLWLAGMCLMMTGCAGTSAIWHQTYTRDYHRRDDQARWIDEKEAIRTVAECVAAADMVNGYPAARRKLAIRLRIWYEQASNGGRDVDGGVRALNFIRKLLSDADGDSRFWHDTVRLAAEPDAEGVIGDPIPSDY